MFDHEAGPPTHDALMVDVNKDETYEYNDAPQSSLSTCLLRTISGCCGVFSMFFGYLICVFSAFASDSGNKSSIIQLASFAIILGINVSLSGLNFIYSACTGGVGSWWNIWDIIKEHTIYCMVCVAVWLPLAPLTAFLFTSLIGDASFLFVVVVSLGLATYVYISILKRDRILPCINCGYCNEHGLPRFS